jgi:hypothetical protein
MKQLSSKNILFILILIVLIGLAVFSTYLGNEFILKLIGVILQGVGIGLALWVLKELRDSLSERTLKKEIITWFENIFNSKKNVIVNVEALIMSSTLLEAKIGVWHSDNDSLSADEKIILISNSLKDLWEKNADLESTVKELRLDINQFKQMVDVVKSELEKKINEDLETIHLSDWPFSTLSLIFILLGSIISSFSKEIIQCFY